MGRFGSISEFQMALDNIVSSTSRRNPSQMFSALKGAGFAGSGPDEGHESPYQRYGLEDLPDAELHNMALTGDPEAAYELRRREQRKKHKRGKKRRKKAKTPPPATASSREVDAWWGSPEGLEYQRKEEDQTAHLRHPQRKKSRKNRGARRLAGARLGYQSHGVIENPKRKSRKNAGPPPGPGMQFVAPTRSVGSSTGGKQYKDPWARVGASVGGAKKLMPGLTAQDRKDIAAGAKARGVGMLRHILEHLGFSERDILRAHQWMETEGVLSYGTGRYSRDRKTKRKAMQILMAVKQGKNNPRRRR